MKAAAFVVGPLDGPGAALMDMARRAGFETVRRYGGVGEAEAQAATTPVCFFLFASVPDARLLRSHAEAIRFCPSKRVRFSPMVYFAETASVDTIGACINMGFDDIVTLPAGPERVGERLGRQLGRNLVFYETPGYFGPDRRDRVTAPHRAAESRLGGQFRRLEIVRDLEGGVEVLRDEFYRQQAV